MSNDENQIQFGILGDLITRSAQLSLDIPLEVASTLISFHEEKIQLDLPKTPSKTYAILTQSILGKNLLWWGNVDYLINP